VRLFELGKSFNRSDKVADGPMSVAGIEQHLHLAGLAYGSVAPEQWGQAARVVDFYDVKADVEAMLKGLDIVFEVSDYPAFHPGRCARITLGGMPIAYLGELHPRWVQKYELPLAPIVFEIDVHAINQVPLGRYQEVAKYPAVARDLALIVDNSVTHEQVKSVLWKAAGPLTREINLFDVFKGGNISSSQKSLAFRIVMQDFERTLTDADSEQEMQVLLAAAESTLNAKRR
jgi:phenylalanyl-tRNA synthetase beta chain